MAIEGPITIHTAAQFFPDGKVTEKRFVDEFEKPITLLADLEMVEATGIMEDESDFLEPYTYDVTSQVVDLDHGAKSHTYGNYRRKQPMQMREAALVFKKKHQKFVPGAYAATTELHIQMTISRTALDFEHDVFYADPVNNQADRQYMIGLAPRFPVLTDEDGVVKAGDLAGEVLSTICLDAGGTTGGSLGSAYVIVPGSDAACLVYPNGSDLAGFEYEPGEYQRTKDENGGLIDERGDIFRFTGGLSLRQRHAAIRIANIDTSTNDGLKKFMDCFYQIGDVMPQELVSRAILYIPQKMRSKLCAYLDQRVTYITPENAGFNSAFRMPYIDGLGPVRPTSQLLLTEGKIA